MTSDDPRVPEYDPESVGLPDTVDPDSTAYDEDDSVREADGDPVMWPDDRPLALDEFGTSAEAGRGESLDTQLARETPDFGAEDSVPVTESDNDNPDGDPDELSPDLGDEAPDPYAEDEAEDADGFTGALEDDEPVNPYEGDDPVGRLADDERSDPNDRSFADDVGMAGGGASAEESAMHVVGDDDQDADF